MKNRIITVLLTGTFALQTSFSALAATANVNYNAADGKVTVSGNTAGNQVSITVVKDGVDLRALSNANYDDIEYFKFVSPNDNGVYTDTFSTASLVAGKYVVSAVDNDGEDTGSFIVIDNASDVSAINSAATKETLKTAVEAKAVDFGVDTTTAEYIADNDKTYEILVAVKNNYANPAEFINEYNVIFALARVINAGNDNGVTLEKVSTFFGLDYASEFKNRPGLSDSAKSDLLKLMAAYDWKTELKNKDFKITIVNIFKELRALAAVRTAETSAQLEKVMTVDFEDDFAFVSSDSTYNGLSLPSAVYGLMIPTSGYSTMDNVKKAFESAVDKRHTVENKNSNSSGNTGGGGGFGGISVPGTSNNEPSSEKAQYKDVPETYWGYVAIENLAGRNIINGYPNGTYMPENGITRAELAKILDGVDDFLGGNAADEVDNIVFDDVFATDWFAEPVESAAKKGIVNGIGSGFGPNLIVTRQDAAVMIYRMVSRHYQLDSNASFGGFSDSGSISDYAQAAVSTLAGNSLISGLGDGTFAPKNSLTRAQAAQLIYNVLKYFNK